MNTKTLIFDDIKIVKYPEDEHEAINFITNNYESYKSFNEKMLNTNFSFAINDLDTNTTRFSFLFDDLKDEIVFVGLNLDVSHILQDGKFSVLISYYNSLEENLTHREYPRYYCDLYSKK